MRSLELIVMRFQNVPKPEPTKDITEKLRKKILNNSYAVLQCMTAMQM
jgi:hypothetical protein